MPPATGSGGTATGGTSGSGTAGTSGTGAAGATGGSATGGSGTAGAGGGGSGGTTAGTGGTGGSAPTGTAGGGGAGRGGTGGQGGQSGGGGAGSSGRGGTGGTVGTGGATGGGGTAGTVGTGGAAGWFLGGGSKCAGAAYIVCEDFESTADGATPTGDWSLPTTNYGTGTIAVASDFAARGSRALKVTIPSTGGTSAEKYLQRRNITALANGHFGRIFFRIQGPTTTAFVHWDLILGAGPYMGSNRRIRWGVTGTAVGTTNNNWAWIYNIEQGDTGVEARTVHPTLNTWMCVEWQWDAANQRVRFYFNDTEATALHVDTTLPNGTALQIPTFSTMSFGLAKYQTTNADLVFWIDEIALDTQRIGCAN
jgi:hypothetical protein